MDESEIGDGIYQGAATEDTWPQHDAVLDLQQEHEDAYLWTWSIKALAWMPIPDGDFPGLPWLQAAVDTVLAWRRAGWTVLIHCAAGVSRSGMVDVACQMQLHHLTRDAALELVRSKRPQTNPNANFMAGLAQFEATRTGGPVLPGRSYTVGEHGPETFT
jgi:hypothetical protein